MAMEGYRSSGRLGESGLVGALDLKSMVIVVPDYLPLLLDLPPQERSLEDLVQAQQVVHQGLVLRVEAYLPCRSFGFLAMSDNAPIVYIREEILDTEPFIERFAGGGGSAACYLCYQ